MNDPKKLKEIVIAENIKVHSKEAPIYEIIHPQLFNWYHTKKSWGDINFIFKTLGSRQGLKVLDLGCGTGFLTTKLLTWPKVEITAVDLSKEMLFQLEKKLSRLHQDNITLINKEAVAFLRLNGNQYDLITASAFLHHLADFEDLLDVAIKRLKSGGVFYIAYEPLKQDIDSKVQFMFHRIIRTLDVSLFNMRMKKLGVEVDDSHEKSIADYQTTLGGIDPNEIISYLKGKGDVLRLDKFATRAYWIFALIADKLVRSQNTFSIIFRKS